MTTAIRDGISPDLRATLRALKLGQMLHTLPDRLTLARQQNMTHADFLELVLADEVARREAKSASLRARAAECDLFPTGSVPDVQRRADNGFASKIIDNPVASDVGVGVRQISRQIGRVVDGVVLQIQREHVRTARAFEQDSCNSENSHPRRRCAHRVRFKFQSGQRACPGRS